MQDVAEGQGVRRQRKSRNRRERERDTGKTEEKGVSRMGWGVFIKMEQISREESGFCVRQMAILRISRRKFHSTDNCPELCSRKVRLLWKVRRIRRIVKSLLMLSIQ